jgi:hypothetical protein
MGPKESIYLKKVAESVSLVACIREVPRSSLGQEIDWTEAFRGVPQSVQSAGYGLLPQPYNSSFPTHIVIRHYTEWDTNSVCM